MPVTSPPAPGAGRPMDDTPQTTKYVLVLVTEVISIAVLYWIGAHFG